MRLLLLPVAALLVVGCMATDMKVPTTIAERAVYESDPDAHPHGDCDTGYKKVYYIVKGDSVVGDKVAMIRTHCLEDETVVKLKQLQIVSEGADADTASIISSIE